MLVSERIAYIQSLFRKIHENPGSSLDPVEDAGDFLPEYVSVIYEACSARLAAIELKSTAPELREWKHFFDAFADRHRSQLFVGLGWSLAETGVTDFFKDFSSSDQWRMADGYGYYSGLFKRREAVRQQLIPEEIPLSLSGGFDQGLGRSFWYLTQGDPARIQELILLFREERHPSLWRGVGLAMSYVGGVDKTLLDTVLAHAGPHLSAFKSGALLAIDGRSKTGLHTADDLFLQKELNLPEGFDFLQKDHFAAVLEQVEKLLNS